MTKPDRAVNVMVLAGSDLEFDAVRHHLADVRVAGPAVVGTIPGTEVPVALHHLDRVSEFLQRPKAILVARAADALRDFVNVGDVVVATRLDHYPGQGSPEFGTRFTTTWRLDGAVHAHAAELARDGWRGADPEVPCQLHLRPVATVRNATTLTRPVSRDFGEAVVIDSERPLPAYGDVPMCLVYGVGARADRGLDVSVLTRSPAALANLAVFTLALAVGLDADADAVVRRLHTRGHGDRVARTDLLARDAFVESLAELLAYAPPADDDEDLAGPTVIAIEGAWGAGKSTLMDMTRVRLDSIGPADVASWGRVVVPRWRRRKVRAWEADRALSGWDGRSRLSGRDSRSKLSGRDDSRKLSGPDGRSRLSGRLSRSRLSRMFARSKLGEWLSRSKPGEWFARSKLTRWLSRSPRPPEVEAPRVLTAVFNPWSYQKGEHVWAGLNDCIVGTGAPVVAGHAGSSLQRFWFTHNIERLDRRHVQRTLRQRIVSPLLRLGVFALPVPLLVQLLRAPDPYHVLGYVVQPVDLALWITGVLLGTGLAHTAVRYVARAADTLLPAELFGPLTAYEAGAGTDDPLRDPQRRARMGPLHSAQQDVQELIRELGAAGSRLVVFIDDLDRCSPRTTADVFEAINGFLSVPYPSIRFVLGIDAAATAAHLDAAYSALVVADAGRDSADPSPGWTFLRKLIQLPLPLPRVVRTHVGPLLTGLLGAPRPAAESRPDDGPAEVPATAGQVTQVADSDTAVTGEIETASAVVALEHDEQVQARFAERLGAQPDLSVREAKRILTVWMFYVRVLDRLSPQTGAAAVRRACHLVLLAEIVARWPASQRCLHRRVNGVHGLRALAWVVDDSARWELEVRRFGLDGDRHRSFRSGVREILRGYDAEEIAKLAEQLT